MDRAKDINRFEAISASLTDVQKEVYTLETWLNIKPFPKFKHTVKYLRECMK